MRAAPYSRVEKAFKLAPAGDTTQLIDLVATHHANLLAVVGRLDDAAALDRRGNRESPAGTQRDGASHLGRY